EHLGNCPSCKSTKRQVFFSELTDGVYGAPGRWTLWKCEECQAAYLDPRPSPASIWSAYQGYYTHIPTSKPGFRRQIREQAAKLLRNDYLNARFGHSLRPNLRFLGRYLINAPSNRSRSIDYHIRHLPPPSETGSRLLEIGPGDGAFLRVAKRLGYVAEGLEPDEDAVATRRSVGLDVRPGGVPQTPLEENAYEHVVLSHVVEHLHEPAEALLQIWKALEPGGRVWIATPNLGSS